MTLFYAQLICTILSAMLAGLRIHYTRESGYGYFLVSLILIWGGSKH